jgi:hydroxymethylglutaryl-CoA synthase
VGSDVAKYELASTGEYTQGAGAIAVLIKEQPRLLDINPDWGVATRGVHDFFKPVRRVSKRDLIEEVLQLTGKNGIDIGQMLERMAQSLEVKGILDDNESTLTLHKDTPVFDGPYSNECYQQRISEALAHFGRVSGAEKDDPVTDNWRRLVFHLPYAFQARRMFSEVFYQEALARGDWDLLKESLGMEAPRAEDFSSTEEYKKAYAKFLRAITKTTRYNTFVAQKVVKGEWASSYMGNLYTSSLFLSLMSTLELDLEESTTLAGSQIGFFGYGSGSKSKVFEGTVQPGWEAIVERFQLRKRLDARQAIDYATYEKLHRGNLEKSVAPVSDTFFLAEVCNEKGVLEGARRYGWQKKTVPQPTS